MISIDAAGTAALLDFGELVDAVAQAAVELSAGAIRCPERLVTPLAGSATMLSMPAAADDVAIHKLITVAPGNAARGQPTLQGVVSVFDPLTGALRMMLDGPTVTGRRTAAVSMLAMRLLSTAPRRVLLVGTGAQAGHHVAALAALHPDAALRVRGSTPASAISFCARHRERFADLAPVTNDFEPDVILTCTTSSTPVLHARPHATTLIVATGSFRPTIAEIAPHIVRASIVCVDDLRGARMEAGDLRMAGVDWDAVVPMSTLVEGREIGFGPIVFKSVGCAAWDLACARVALRAHAPAP